ncbi:hypothetical protein [Zooshikella sp. RANM57]|uniref:hypothetical protein n=1 Tax=Zooshikella sp. RANM57 TaxID=3425863 RepID=UPI003D6E70DA
MNGRFVFSVDDSWDSNDYIDVKITDEYIYLGVDFPLSFTVKALKIPRAQCVQEGTKTYYFKKRDVVSLPSDDSIKRKVALIP